MPRDSSETRTRLVAEAERLFAEEGIWQVNVSSIVEAAGQRNASAVSYHFGSRQGILDEILVEHGDAIDVERGQLLVGIDETSSTDAVVAALIRPLTARLHTERGRRYLRILAQFTPGSLNWREAGRFVPPHLSRALQWIEARPEHVAAEVRAERVDAMIMLMTASLADRATRLTDRQLTLDDPSYEANLIDMLVAVIEAPTRVAA